MPSERVLVTGGTGFLGGHCIAALLTAGYAVRTTLRDLRRVDEVRAMLASAGFGPEAPVTYFAADLTDDRGWAQAVAGCTYVLHVASPFPAGVPRSDDELVIPARDGTLRVLHAARAAGVRRVVVTSSFAAVAYGLPMQKLPFDETSWTDLATPGLGAYVRAKTLAERAAWADVVMHGAPELTVLNPVGILGPALGPRLATSLALVKRLLDGKLLACPRLAFGVVDVRDVADLHVRAMTAPKAAGERFIAAAGDPIAMADVAAVLARTMGKSALRVPTGTLPDWVVRGIGVVSPTVRLIVPELGVVRAATSAKAKRLLGWEPRTNAQAITAAGDSLVRLGLIGTTAPPARRRGAPQPAD